MNYSLKEDLKDEGKTTFVLPLAGINKKKHETHMGDDWIFYLNKNPNKLLEVEAGSGISQEYSVPMAMQYDALVLEKAYKLAETTSLDRYAYYCGQCFSGAGDKDKAIEWYKIALQTTLSWDYKFVTCINIGNMYSDLKNNEQAVLYWMKSLEHDPSRIEGISKVCEYFWNQESHFMVNSLYERFKGYTIFDTHEKLFSDPTKYYTLEYYNSISAFYSNNKQSGYECCKKLLLANKYIDITCSNICFYKSQLESDEDDSLLLWFCDYIEKTINACDTEKALKMFKEYETIIKTRLITKHEYLSDILNDDKNFNEYIRFIISQTNASRETVKEHLAKNNDDIVNTILSIKRTFAKKQSSYVNKSIVDLIDSDPDILKPGMMLKSEIYGNIYYLNEAINNIEGDIVELGCNVGTTSIFIQRWLDITNSDKEFNVYDSWEGLPEVLPVDESQGSWPSFKKGQCKTSKESFINNFKQRNLKLPKIHSGWFKEIPDEEYPNKIAFAFLDGDLYSSIMDSLNKIYHKMSKGGIIIIDDCGWNVLPGCKKAVDDFLKDKPETLTLNGYTDSDYGFNGDDQEIDPSRSNLNQGGKIVKL